MNSIRWSSETSNSRVQVYVVSSRGKWKQISFYENVTHSNIICLYRNVKQRHGNCRLLVLCLYISCALSLSFSFTLLQFLSIKLFCLVSRVMPEYLWDPLSCIRRINVCTGFVWVCQELLCMVWFGGNIYPFQQWLKFNIVPVSRMSRMMVWWHENRSPPIPTPYWSNKQ